MLSPLRGIGIVRRSVVLLSVIFSTIILLEVAGQETSLKPEENNAIRIISFQPPRLSIEQFFNDNCVCISNLQCSCCGRFFPGGVFNLRDLCFDWMIIPSQAAINTTVTHNNGTIITNTFSVNDMPPICFPVLPQISLTGCFKFHSIGFVDDKMHICANATLGILINTFLNFPLGCLDFDRNGINISNRTDIRIIQLPEITFHKKIASDLKKTGEDIQKGATDFWMKLTKQGPKTEQLEDFMHDNDDDQAKDKPQKLDFHDQLIDDLKRRGKDIENGASNLLRKFRFQRSDMDPTTVAPKDQTGNGNSQQKDKNKILALHEQIAEEFQKRRENLNRGASDLWKKLKKSIRVN